MSGSTLAPSASHDSVDDTSNSNTRRSISIFSRRGTEQPEARPPFIVQAAMKGTSRARVEKSTAQPSKAKASTITMDPNSKNRKKTKGTVLNAVPPNRGAPMTALEVKMATLPNEEILSSIGEHYARVRSSVHGSSTGKRYSVVRRTHSTKRRDADSRIGVWVDGVVHWDAPARPASKSWEKTIEEETGLVPVLSAPAREAISGRPHLSVVIPHTRLSIEQLSRPSVRAASEEEAAPQAAASDSGKSDTPPIPPRCPFRPGSSSNIRQRASQALSSTDESVVDEDDASVVSKDSSATSVEMATPPSELPPAKLRPSTGMESPADASGHLNKPLPPIPHVAAARASMIVAPLSPPLTGSAQPARNSTSSKSSPTAKRSSTRSMRVSRSMNQLDLCDQEFMSTAPYSLHVPDRPSPTLSQAETDLRNQLSTLTKSNTVAGTLTPKPAVQHENASAKSSLDRSTSMHSVMHPPENAPTLPIRSRKRDWRLSDRSSEQEQQASIARPRSELHPQIAQPIEPLQRSASMQVAASIADPNQEPPRTSSGDANRTTALDVPSSAVEDTRSSDDFTDAHESVSEETVHAMSASAAEDVLLHILASMQSAEDLFNIAMINRGMYRVFKENEMFLLRAVTYNQSPVLWELREWSPPERSELQSSKASSQLEHTPVTYMRCHRRDVAVIERLKALILAKCQTTIRRETAFALSTPSHPNAPRFNDAFWRIWCFCKAFGSNKGREEDITGQLDWLKGGLLAHNERCVATVDTNPDFDPSSVLLNAPDHFAMGNMDGLSSGQLLDITEIWTCLSSLLQGYQGRVDVARTFGVYDHCEVEVDEIEKEEQILEEWTAYLLTLGPAVVLEMAELAADPGTTGFELAKANGWTTWAEPMYKGSRQNFLKEPVRRLYQERINEEQERVRDPRAAERKEQNRQRVANLAKEIRLRRQHSDYKRLPLIDMEHERPMSMFSRNSVRSTRSAASTHSRVASASVMRSPTVATESSRAIEPIAEDGAEAVYHPAHLSRLVPGLAHDTSERAVHKIVNMGFTPNEARVALRATECGHGAQIDKAIEYLISPRE